MRILYLTNGFPYPLTSGYLRHYYLIKELSQSHQITLCSITGSAFLPEHAQALTPFTEDIFPFTNSRRQQSKGMKILQRIQALTGITLVANETVSQMKVAVQKLVRQKPFDLVFLSGKETYPAIEGLDNLPVVVDMCDATSTRISGRMHYTNPILIPYLALEYLHIRKVEQGLVRRAMHVLFASCRDQEALLDPDLKPSSVIPNGVDLDYWQRSTPRRGKNTIVFTGVMNYPPNKDAALFLIEQVFPLILRSHPEAQLWIVGKDPDAQLLTAGQRNGVKVTGYVDDVRPYLEQATVFVAPLRFGAGIQNKILEAMAMMVPVVSSHLAADGLRTRNGDFPPIHIARDREEYASLIASHLDAWEEDPTPALANRQYIERHFSWERGGKELISILESVVRKTR